MTSEHRTLIDLTDIVAVEFECEKCAAKVLYPLAKNYERFLLQCPNCNENWFAEPNPVRPVGNDLEPMKRVAKAITQLRDLVGSTDVRAHVRLQITNMKN
jgi:hypothetical protein